MTDAELDDFARKVREMRDAATPGPWGVGMQTGLNANHIYAYQHSDPFDDEGIAMVYGIPVNRARPLVKGAPGLPNATFIAALPDIAAAFLRQHEECKRLESWRQEALALEDTWDVQAIGKLIKAPLGSDIRANIQPYIERLEARVKDLEDAIILARTRLMVSARPFDDGCAILGAVMESAPNEGGE